MGGGLLSLPSLEVAAEAKAEHLPGLSQISAVRLIGHAARDKGHELDLRRVRRQAVLREPDQRAAAVKKLGLRLGVGAVEKRVTISREGGIN